ncbi:MAG: outer membrane protein assembly factor BamA [Desulfobacterales bacterium]|nr:outer membrane protein assembly factor BamA [Desulfobacterales bacterium]
MFKRLYLLVITLFLLLPNTVIALETSRVLVLPFEINSKEDLSYLGSEIPDVISRNLEIDGAEIVNADMISDSDIKEKLKDKKGIREIGINAGADFVVRGSMTLIGSQISLDANVFDLKGRGSPSRVYAEGKEIENLPGVVQSLSRKLSMKIFNLQVLTDIRITGNRRIEVDAIRKVMNSEPGDLYVPKNISGDLKAIYAMGYFDDIRVEAVDGAEGKIVIFKVTEKPTIRMIRIKGNKVFDTDEIMEDTLTIKTGSILNDFIIQNNVTRIESLYKEKNYQNIKVSYKITPLENNQADLDFDIIEGEKVKIKEITFEGNKAFSSDDLLDEMDTETKGFWSWITSTGSLDRDTLSQDIANLAALYKNSGYIDARIGEPRIEYIEDWIYITIKIEEGPQFTIGTVDIEGDLIFSHDDMMDRINLSDGSIFSMETVRGDVITLTDMYSDMGYAYAKVSPKISKDLDTFIANVQYSIKKGSPVYIEKIIINGNIKTRDKVVRRELRVYEQELYSGKNLKRSIRNLYRLDFFEDIQVDTTQGSAEDRIVVEIDVAEKSTGNFSFGGGYSTEDGPFIVGSITERNAFGLGHVAELKAEHSSDSTRFNASYTEPYLMDTNLSVGLNAYNWLRDYDEYERDSVGAGFRFGYPVWDYTRAYLSYGHDNSNITDILKTASQDIKDLEGENITHSISSSLIFDSRDKAMNPSSGQIYNATVRYAGLGGDVNFIKFEGTTSVYIPIFLGIVGHTHAEGGYVREHSGGILPDYERFYLGGMNSVRGFDYRDISAYDERGREIGGDKYLQLNVELIIPLIKDQGLVGVLFYDTGNVWDPDSNVDLGDMRNSAGYGIRWYSPMGPLRLENGHILDPDSTKDEDSGGKWEFTIGTAF